MSTATPGPHAGLSVQAVAQATGLDRASIYRAAEAAQLGAPAHFTYRGTQIVYTFPGLCQMVEGLELLREDGAARLPRAAQHLAQQAAATAEAATVPSARMVEHWLARYERDQEEAAA